MTGVLRSRRRVGFVLAVVMSVLTPLVSGCGGDEPASHAAAEAEAPADIVRQAVANPDPWLRAEAARLLVHAPAELRTGALQSLLGDDDPMVQLLAADSLLAHDATDDRALATLEAQLRSPSQPARHAALGTARRHLAVALQADLFETTIRTAVQPETRRAATAALVELLRTGGVSPARARTAEQNLVSLATDPDVIVAGTALEYVTSVSRLAGEAETLRNTLKTLLAGSDVAGQERALQLLTRAADPDLATLAYDPYVKAGDDPSLTHLRQLATIALGSTGETFRAAELAELARRDTDREIQLAAIGALARINSADARLALAEALENPIRDVRRHALRSLIERHASVTIPESVLRADDTTARVLALRLLWQQSPTKFERLVTQKLQVESYRDPLVIALATWLDQVARADAAEPGSEDEGEARQPVPAPDAAPDWLSRLRPALEPLVERATGDDPTVDTALYRLWTRLEGTRAVLDRMDTLPLGGRYAVLRSALETNVRTPAFETALLDPYFVVRLLGAIGAAR